MINTFFVVILYVACERIYCVILITDHFYTFSADSLH